MFCKNLDSLNHNSEINDAVLERIALLECQVTSLQEEAQQNKREKKASKNQNLNNEGSILISEITSEDTSIDQSEATSEDTSEKGSLIIDEDIGEVNANARKPRNLRISNISLLTQRIYADDDFKALSEDTFTMMIMSKPGSKQWWYALNIFLVQITLLVMIFQDQLLYDYTTTPFDVPYRVTNVVHAGQLLAIFLSLTTQTDLVISIVTFVMLWSRRRVSWTKVAAVAKDSHNSTWTIRIAIPLGFKFIEGVLVLLTTFVIIIQSDSMIELFKDFAAMQLISELDNMMFWLALHGYAGGDLMQGAMNSKKVRIKDDVVKSFCGIPIRTMILFILFCFMFSGWVFIVVGQANGSFFSMKFSQCNINEVKIPSMGNGICDGGEQNTIGCNFDDGDCLAFNIAYPGCRVVETYMIGDGECNPEFNLIECGFDGGDCCPVENDDRLGDGHCDGFVFNTPICGYDGGDCEEFNSKYPNCMIEENYTLNELYHEQRLSKNDKNDENDHFAIGDGICQALPMYNTPECGYEGGDCKECFEMFEDRIKNEEDFLEGFANGHCDGPSPLNVEACSYDGGDCMWCMEDNIDTPGFNISRIADGVCDGGFYMSEACEYEGDDCSELLDEYPDCEAKYPWKLNNGDCDSENNNEECGYDGGDCQVFSKEFNLIDCDVDDISRIQDGNCDGGKYLTESCLFDGGDCEGCDGLLDFIGDGFCDGGIYMTKECGFDGGDCDQCNAADPTEIGNGVCNENLNNADCYYDGGDCSGGNTTSSVFGL